MNQTLNIDLNTKGISYKAEGLLDMHREVILKKAEALLQKARPDISKMSPDDIQKLLFELQVHQIELKMQNEELNRAHQNLAESRDDYAQLYDLSPVGYLTLNEAGIIQKANIAASELLGHSKQALINMRLGKFIHPSDQDNYYLFMRGLLSLKNWNKSPSPTGMKNICFQLGSDVPQPSNKNNVQTYIECEAKVVVDAKNKPLIFISLSNVSERVQAQRTIIALNEKLEEKIQRQNQELFTANLNLMKKVEELKHSKRQLIEREAKLNAIFNASVEGIITVNTLDLIVSVNTAAETIFGYKREELVGCNINKIIPLSSKINQYCLPGARIECTGQIQETEGICKDGVIVPLDMSIAEFEIDNTHYFTSIVRDVSSRKRQEQLDKEHLNELAHVTRLGLIGEMASGISHEVNQPLSAISVYAQASLNIISSNKPDLAKLTEILHKTLEQALRAGKIIHRMRDFVRPHSLQCSTTNINSLIQDATGLCFSDLKQRNIKIKFELDDNLPLIFIDHIQIEQVIINLIRNSIDALTNLPEKKQAFLTIQSSLTSNNYIRIMVKDNGTGLNENQKQKVLTPFYTTKADGMGMGLSISRSLVEAHEGTLHFNSELGKGTSFYFTLPIRRRSNDEH